MKVGFFSNQLSLRGTEEVMYSYADYNETVFKNTSVIISFPLKTETKDTTKESYERFEKRFETFYITDEERIIQHQLDTLVVKEKIDVLYIAKWGIINNTITSKCPTIVHAVFKMCQPHGDVYVGVSEYVATQAGFPPTQCLPNIVRPCSITTSLRYQLRIPEDALVIGRHGGYDTFNIEYVKQYIIEFATTHPSVHFVFLNTERFIESPNVHFLPGTVDPISKKMFINTCDVMIHARDCGESFGVSCAEFSIYNKPVITCLCGDTAHIDILRKRGGLCTGTTCFVYKHETELEEIFEFLLTPEGREYIKTPHIFSGYLPFTPERIMPVFESLLHRAIEAYTKRV